MPPDGEIVVWDADLEPASEPLAELLAIACVPKRSCSDARSIAARRRLVAQAILRVTLARGLACLPQDVLLERGADGKPRLGQSSGELHFNLTHSGARALIAVCADREVGVDLERIRPDRSFEALARRHFTPRERRLVCSSADTERARTFYRLWTAKEACLKATGDGLRSLASVEVALDRAGCRARWSEAPRLGADVWRVQELDVGVSWAGSLAAPGTDWRAELRRWQL